jgi:hypothetical protein
MNGTLLSQFGSVAELDFEGSVCSKGEGRTAELVIVLMKRSL